MTLDAIEKLPQTQITAFNNKLMGMMHTNQWAWLTLLLVWLFSILLIIYLWIQSSKSKKQLFVSALVLGLLGVVSYTITSTKYTKLHSEQFGIVFSEVIQVNNEPNQRSEVQFILHEGTKSSNPRAISRLAKNPNCQWCRRLGFRSYDSRIIILNE